MSSLVVLAPIEFVPICDGIHSMKSHQDLIAIIAIRCWLVDVKLFELKRCVAFFVAVVVVAVEARQFDFELIEHQDPSIHHLEVCAKLMKMKKNNII